MPKKATKNVGLSPNAKPKLFLDKLKKKVCFTKGYGLFCPEILHSVFLLPVLLVPTHFTPLDGPPQIFRGGPSHTQFQNKIFVPPPNF